MCKITISFKNTKKDRELFEKVQNQEEKSDYIKRAIEYYSKYIEVSTSPF